MIEAVAWGLGTGLTALAISNTLKGIYGKKVCALHGALMSDIVSIKSAMIKVTIYVSDKATEEGRDLNKEIMDTMMKR